MMQILKAGYVKSSEVGIITSYDAQRKRFRNEITGQAKVSVDFIILI